MANFPPIHGIVGSGGWPPGYVVTQLDFQKLDEQSTKTANFADGSTHAPAATVNVGGSGFTFSGANHHLPGTLTVDSGGILALASGSVVTAISGAVVRGTLALGDGTGGATISLGVGSLTLASGTTLTLNGNVAVGAVAITVDAGAAIAGTVHFSQNVILNVSSALIGNGSANWSSGGTSVFSLGHTLTIATLAASLTGVLSLSGGGHIRKRFTTGTDGNATYGVNATDVLTFTGISFSADHTNTITSTGAGEGSEIIVALGASSGGHLITFIRDDTTTICSLHGTAASGITSARLAFRGGAWAIAEMTPNGH